MSKSHEIDCWKCGEQSTLKTRSEFDGCCWACGAEIDLEDYLARAMDECDQLRAEVERLRKERVPAGLYRELVALRELRNQAKAYIDGYLLDEIDDVDCCVSEDQHLSAAALSRLLQEAISAQRDAAPAGKGGE